jgi:hypothetical protein
VWSAGSTAFTSASGTFSTANVGQPIYLSGAGVNGTTLATTIAAVGDAHSLTLTAAPSAPSTSKFANSAIVLTSQSGAGSYAPGDTLTLSGGTFTVPSVFSVLKTKLASATINAAGSGGTNSTTLPCVVTGTTGTGRKSRLNVTVAGGVITSVDSLWDAGEYTVNPTSLAAEPVTGCNLTGATLALKMGVSIPALVTPGIYSVVSGAPGVGGQGNTNGPVSTTTSGSGTGATLQVSYTPFPGVGNVYALGSDNTAALSAAVAQSNALWLVGTRACVYFPSRDSRFPAGAGYLMASEGTHFTRFNPACVKGDGADHSVIRLGSNFSGDLFRWDDVWGQNNFPYGGTSAISQIGFGARLEGVSIFGDTAAPGQQNAIVINGNSQFSYVNDVGCYYVHGYCLQGGELPGSNTIGVLTESRFENLRFSSSGTELIPTVLVSTFGAVGASNQLDFDNMRLLRCRGQCMVFQGSAGTGGGVGGVTIIAPNIERSMDGDDLVVFGDPARTGPVVDVNIIGGGVFQTSTDHAGIRITGPNAANQYGYKITDTEFGLGAGNGIVIDAGRGSSFKPRFSGPTGAGFQYVVGPAPAVGAPLIFDVPGTALDTFLVDPSATNTIFTPFKSAGSPSVLGTGAVNLQSIQNAIANMAQGDRSVTIGDGTVGIGTGGADSYLIGSNMSTSQPDNIGFGRGNVLTGAAGVVLGFSGCDNGNNRHFVWATGNINAACDAQLGQFQFKGKTTDATPIALTTNNNPAPGFSTIANLPTDHVFIGPVLCVARDQSSKDIAAWHDLHAIISKGTQVNTTTLKLSALTRIFNDAGAAAWTLNETADTTNGGILLTFTGEVGKTLHATCGFTPVVELQ